MEDKKIIRVMIGLGYAAFESLTTGDNTAAFQLIGSAVKVGMTHIGLDADHPAVSQLERLMEEALAFMRETES